MIRSPEQFVYFSAHLMAAVRAKETERSDRLFNDPFAAKLAGKEALSLVNKQLTPQDQTYVAVRTRIFDDFLLSHIGDTSVKGKSLKPKINQVVMLASGMDTRAYRLQLPKTCKIFELDYPEIIDYKAELLQESQPNCEHYAIATDLTKLWTPKLLAAGYDITKPSIWLLEGLLMYLNESDAHTLLQTLSRMTAPDSKMGVDLVNCKAALDYKPYKGYFRSGIDTPDVVLHDYGWQTQVLQLGDPEANFGRISEPPPPPEADVPRAFIILGSKIGS